MVDCIYFFFFKQKTAYEMRISDWSSDVCSSDLGKIRRSGCSAGQPAGQYRADETGGLRDEGRRGLSPALIRPCCQNVYAATDALCATVIFRHEAYAGRPQGGLLQGSGSAAWSAVQR